MFLKEALRRPLQDVEVGGLARETAGSFSGSARAQIQNPKASAAKGFRVCGSSPTQTQNIQSLNPKAEALASNPTPKILTGS